ncbi:MAG: hypothetical protein A3K03_08050 [Bdellovibrionales bacterium RIFOXYD1_FULL_44_7]|nr:MAG: hypothetical protein A3K03_08050 [Bdellovibrionales bacterium RIFOXYD1_FULL_44_7]
MELIYDWRTFQQIFHPKNKAAAVNAVNPTGPVFLVADKGNVISAFAEKEDLSELIGSSLSEIEGRTKHRELVAFDLADFEGWINESNSMPHFYEQAEFLRAKAITTVNGGRKESARSAFKFRKHFLVEAINSWWSKILPSSYGIYLKIEGSADEEILLLIRGGAFVAFHKPDLSILGNERKKQPPEVIKYLSEKYLVPVQGLYVSKNDWSTWCQAPQPWKLVAKAIRANGVKVVPFRWPLVLLMSFRAFFGI